MKILLDSRLQIFFCVCVKKYFSVDLKVGSGWLLMSAKTVALINVLKPRRG